MPTGPAAETSARVNPLAALKDREVPDQWRIEWFDDDGRSEFEISEPVEIMPSPQ